MPNKKSGRQPVTIEEGLKTVILFEVRISPQGRLVSYAKSVARDDDKRRGLSIWAVPSDGGKVRQLTQGPKDGQPRWSPDGQTLAFVRKVEEKKPQQIFLLPRDGGEPTQLTKFSDPDMLIEALEFSPDGRYLSYLSPTPDDKKTRERKEKGDDARVFVKDDKPKRLWSVSLKTGKAKAVSPRDLAIWQYDWLPDSRSAAVIYTEEPGIDASYFRPKLGIVRISASELEPLDTELQSMAHLRVSPDGKHLALISSQMIASIGGEAWVIDIKSGQATCLTPDLPASVAFLEWLPDGSGILISVAEGFSTHLYTVKLDSPGKLERVYTKLPANIGAPQIAKDGKSVFVVADDLEESPELWRADLASDDVARLTSENRPAGKLRLGRSQVIRWPSTENFEIEGIVTLPPGFRCNKAYPTILVVHGGPCGRFVRDLGLLSRQLLANQGYVVLMPNPRGSMGYGEDFIMTNFGDWGGGDFRDLMAGLDTLVQQGIADPERLGIYGGSYGGYMVAWVVTQTDRFQAAICQCGVTDLYSFNGQTDITSFLELYFGESPYEDPERFRARSAMTYIKNVKTPTLFLHGEQDVRVPIAQSYEMYWGLRHMGVETEFVIYPREGHGIGEMPHQRDSCRRIVEWFERYLR